MVIALAPPARANCRFQVARSLQLTGNATPLTVIVLTSTGAVPLSVIKLLLVLKLAGPLTANAALPFALATWERMLDPALAIQPPTDPFGENTLTPLARKAADFASLIPLIPLGALANVSIS